MKRSLLASLAAAVLAAGASIGAVALSNNIKDDGRVPTISGSSDQTIVPNAEPSGYPISRWRELQEAKGNAK